MMYPELFFEIGIQDFLKLFIMIIFSESKGFLMSFNYERNKKM